MGLAEPASPVVVVGSVNTDYMVRVSRRPADGETVNDAELSVLGGGKGANQAVAAALVAGRAAGRFGGGADSGASGGAGGLVAMVGRVGDDAAGATRLAELAKHEVLTSDIWVTPGVATGSAFVTVTPGGGNAIMVASGANARLTTADITAAGELIGAARVLLTQLEVPLAAVGRAVQSAGPQTSVVVNCAPFHPLDREVLSHVDLLVANETEAGQMLGGDVGDVRAALAAVTAMLEYGPAAAVITLGADGAVVAAAGDRWHVPAPQVTPIDTTGAGDAFVGALGARLASGVALVPAVEFAVAVGSATTEHLGALARLPVEENA
jgi:ribokinase